MKNYQIAISLPSYNEAKTISRVTKTIDKGLSSFYDFKKCILINIDSKSTDKTIEIFKKTETKCDKISLTPSTKQQGKGQNLITFFKYTKKYNIKYQATFDTDLTSITPDWVSKILKPIISNKCDYVTPLYSRNRFEGSTTNHFAVPLVNALFDNIIRQPIGGEFAFNHRVVDYFLKQQIHKYVYQYGIDIFMTTHALGGGFKTGEIYLGKKFHKPSFQNIIPMFKQVSNTAIECYNQYHNKPNKIKYINLGQLNKIGIDKKSKFKHKNKINNLLTKQIKLITKNKTDYKKILPENYVDLINILNSKDPTIGKELWANILKEFITYFSTKKQHMNFGELLTPIFLIRTISFWLFSEKSTPEIIEKEILLQMKLINNLI